MSDSSPGTRALSRLIIAGIAACLLALSAAGVTWGPSAHAAAGIKLVRGPYLQHVTTTSALVCWEADTVHSGSVLFGITLQYGFIAEAEQSGKAHNVWLSGLAAHTRYYFKVLGDGRELSSGTSFVTLAGPGEDRIDFVAWSDTQANHPVHRQLAGMVREAAPDFIIHMGDLVESGRRQADWDAFFDVERELLAGVPVYPAIGNHDENSPLYFSLFTLPGNERWYSFDSGPAHLVALDVVSSDYKPGSVQHAWLERDLRDTNRPWKIVYFHYPPYHFSPYRGGNEEVRKALTPLFEKYGVQLVLSGHNHSYQRNIVNGVTYVVAAGGGGRLYPVTTGPHTVYTESVHHFLKISVTRGILSITGVRRDGSEFDAFSLSLAPSQGKTTAATQMPGEAATVVPQGTPDLQMVPTVLHQVAPASSEVALVTPQAPAVDSSSAATPGREWDLYGFLIVAGGVASAAALAWRRLHPR